MDTIQREIIALADYLGQRREAILLAWQGAIQRDPTLTSGDSLPRAELVDHVPGLLLALEQGLRRTLQPAGQHDAAQDSATAHGLQRWQQGYNLREVTREWGKLNECVIAEVDRYAREHDGASLEAMARARQVWTRLCASGIEASVHQYFALQQREASGHVKDLESALESLRTVEQERGEVWQQAAHDLRGNLGVVANVTVGLTRQGDHASSRENYVRILMRNVTSLARLLDDMTSLARLHAGRETRRIELMDATHTIQTLCEDVRPFAEERGLHLIENGPVGFAVDGDPVKLRRIAQNLILNAVKYTRSGGITVSWGNSAPNDPKRWMLSIEDTGPGLHTESGNPLAAALEPELPASVSKLSDRKALNAATDMSPRGVAARSVSGQPGEGIGLSIVKRLCEMLDATLEMHSVQNVGTTFRIFFPRRYTP